jgi:uncharacterized protein with von Willebrand factor type A (vWA) domain
MIETTQDAGEGQLLYNIVLFGRLLRRLGFDVTPTQILDLVEALHWIDMSHKEDVKESACAVLVKRNEQLALFDEAFDLFWQVRKDKFPRINVTMLLRRKPQTQGHILGKGDGNTRKSEEPEIEQNRTYSNIEILRHKDFAQMTDDELAQVKAWMQQMPWQPALRRTRRRQATFRGDGLDMRRTFRHNMRYGGEMLRLAKRQRKWKRRPIVLICDISGSMERYARVLLQFMYAISNSMDRVEAFAFSTRLTHLTRQLKRRNIDDALRQATAIVHDWGGGTRIGEALHSFNRQWAQRVLGRGAITLIISDGWDRGAPAELAHEMDRLHRSCHRLIWLNPLLGDPSYQPLTRGIQAALPHVDDFLPVHNLASLAQLAEKLGGLNV